MSSEVKEPIVVEFSPREQLYFQVMNVVDDDLVLDALKKLDRADFMPESLKDKAYEDDAFDVGPDASNSKPSLVGVMIEYLELKGGEKVFELGTAKGFEAEWLSLVVGEEGEVISTEINEGLSTEALKTLDSHGVKNVKILNKDGAHGAAEFGPYDAIIISATFRSIPEELLSQLKEGGIIVAPVGKDPFIQDLVQGRKKDGKMTYKVIDSAVWFHKVFSNVSGAWTQELLTKSRELKYAFAAQYVNFITEDQRNEMWTDIGRHYSDFANIPIDNKIMFQVFVNNRKGNDKFYELLETKTDSTPHPDSTPDTDVLK